MAAAHVSETMSIEEIGVALDRDRFELWFQPIVSLRSLEVRSFEGLARCRDDDGSIISPAQFIDTVEADERIYRRFTRRMIEQAIDFAHRCAAVGETPLITVNLAEPSLRDPTLVEWLEEVLLHSQIPPRQLVFEITEREFLDPASVQSGMLQRLSALGVGLAIDDFGTGWSSLETLRWLPLSQIKIDRSFLERVGMHAADRIIVEKVIELAHSLHLVTVGEGIERPDQLEALRTAGCDRGQGFLFSRPVDADRALELAVAGVNPQLDLDEPNASTNPGASGAGPTEGDTPFVLDVDDLCVGDVIGATSTIGPLALQVLDLLPMAVFIKATDGRIVWSNESHWRRVGALSLAEILDHRDLELHRVDEALRYRVDDLAVLTGGATIVDRHEHQTRPDGTSIDLRTSKFPIRNRDRAVVGMVGFYAEVGDAASDWLERDLRRLADGASPPA